MLLANASGLPGGTHEVRVLQLFDDGDVVELDVEVLVDALQRASNLDVVLQLHRHFVIDERLEETRDYVSAFLVTAHELGIAKHLVRTKCRCMVRSLT
jgi:predicted urease superfamily metal-dependent hydrolase